MQPSDSTSSSDPSFFVVSPKLDCPHYSSLNFDKIITSLPHAATFPPCSNCEVTQENWLCLECQNIACSRNHNSHIRKHNEKTGHKLAFSFSDASFWCYPCNSSVHSKELGNIAKEFSKLKVSNTKNDEAEQNMLAQKLAEMNLSSKSSKKKKKQEESKVFTREDLINGLKNKTFKRIIMLTGAGISVSAGIPDFRSPKTGLYANLKKYKLPTPESIFTLQYYKKNPEPFYKLSKELFTNKVKPVISHHFIKALADEGMLLYNFTQNIDGLEVAAGVHPSLMVEAHGHSRSAHCVKCKKERSIEQFFKHVEEETIYRCECGGLVKPDIVFFGEDLPERFFKTAEEIFESDLVIVMGTSLTVFPFAGLVPSVPKKVPLVYINRDNASIVRDNFLFMEGDIDNQVSQLVKDLGWEDKIAKIKSKI